MPGKLYGRAMARLVGAVAMVLAVGLGPAATQWDSLYDRIIRLEHRLEALENGGAGYTTSENTDPAASASQSLRIGQIEGDLRTLLGQVQNLAFQVQQLTDRLERFAEDTEYRIEQLETGDRTRNRSTPDNRRTANNDQFELPDYGDLSTLEEYPQQNRSAGDEELPPGTQTLGTIPQQLLDDETSAYGGDTLSDDTTTLSAVPEAVTTQPLDDPTSAGGADALYQSSYGHLLKRRFGAAEAGFSRFLKEYGEHELAGNAQYWLGETYYARGQYKKAAQAFLAGYRDHAKSPKAPDSMLKLGMSLRQLGQKKPACETFAQIESRFPNASADVKRLAVQQRKRAGCG